MAGLTKEGLDQLEKLYQGIQYPGTWKSDFYSVYLDDYNPDLYPKDEEWDEYQEADPEAAIATDMYTEDSDYIAALHNAFPQLLDMARENIALKRQIVEDNISDAFTYADPHHWIGQQILHTAAIYYQQLELKDEHWVEHVFNVLTDTVHDSFDSSDCDETDPEDRYRVVNDAWAGDGLFPRTPEEVYELELVKEN